jgi:SAM-dependent methyltransferase
LGLAGIMAQPPSPSPAEAAVAAVARVRRLVDRGELVLANIEAIRALAQSAPGARADLLSDLGVLRYQAGDRTGALALLEAALAEAPEHRLAHKNLSEVRRLLPEPSAVSVDAHRPTGAAAVSPWLLEGLRHVDQVLGLKGREVVELGGAVPAEALRGFGVRRWTAFDLMTEPIETPEYRVLVGDAAALPAAPESFDLAFSICAFEHFGDVGAVLAEAHRVLRPGGFLFAQFSPIWTSSLGHHVWLKEQGRTIFTFNDKALPPWAHLLLDEPELAAFLSLTRGPLITRRTCDYIFRSHDVNRVSEARFGALLAESPFEILVLEPWGGEERPSPALRAELLRRCPAGGDFASNGLRWILRKA